MNHDRLLKRIATLFATSLIGIVFLMGLVLFYKAWPAMSRFGPRFIFTSSWDPVADLFGAFPFIFGTLASSFLALMMAVPLSVGIAVFLSELAPGLLRTPVSFLVELLAAIPSVIYGLWGIFFLVPWLRDHVEPFFINHLGFIPLFKGPAYGVGLFAAALILAIMIVPIISSIARDILKAVPQSQREAAYALGATRWEVTKLAVLKYGRSGIMGAVFLGLGRALGETLAVTMVIGNRPSVPDSLFAPAYTMASVLANEFAEATSDLHLSALVFVALLLFLMTLAINMGARRLVARVARQFY